MLKLNKLMASSALAALLAISSAGISFAGFEEAVKAYEAGDYKTAMNEWMVLAEKNDPAAMRNIGHLYRLGLGTDVNYERALHWYKRASELGFARAQANVASMYLKGQGVAQDYVQAADWFTKAARNGHTIAQYNLGLMYEYGKGVERSTSKALAWYNLAAKAGHPKALNKLSILVATTPDVKAQAAETQVAKETKVAAAEQKAVTPSVEKAETPVKTAKPEPKKVVEVPPTPKATATKSPSIPKVVEPKVVEKSAPAKISAPAPQPAVTNAAPNKRKDPFAGSANNKVLNDETKGAPTAFNAPAPKPVKPETAQAAAPQVVDTKSVETAVEPAPMVESKPDSVVTPAPVPEKPVVAAAPPKAPVIAADEKVVEPAPEKEESKGFFSSLKSLIVGDDDAAENVASAPIPSRPAPAPAIPAPAPQAEAQPVERVVTGNGLSIAERMEMAQLSFTLEQYQQALSVWALLAQEGNAEAQYRLGQMFYKGYAVPVDRVKAYYWWSKAKSNGSAIAASSLEQLDASLTFIEKQQLKSVN